MIVIITFLSTLCHPLVADVGPLLDEEEKVPDASDKEAGFFDVPDETASTAHKLKRTREEEFNGRKPHFLN